MLLYNMYNYYCDPIPVVVIILKKSDTLTIGELLILYRHGNCNYGRSQTS